MKYVREPKDLQKCKLFCFTALILLERESQVMEGVNQA
jgi:hypothetical protein